MQPVNIQSLAQGFKLDLAGQRLWVPLENGASQPLGGANEQEFNGLMRQLARDSWSQQIPAPSERSACVGMTSVFADVFSRREQDGVVVTQKANVVVPDRRSAFGRGRIETEQEPSFPQLPEPMIHDHTLDVFDAAKGQLVSLLWGQRAIGSQVHALQLGSVAMTTSGRMGSKGLSLSIHDTRPNAPLSYVYGGERVLPCQLVLALNLVGGCYAASQAQLGSIAEGALLSGADALSSHASVPVTGRGIMGMAERMLKALFGENAYEETRRSSGWYFNWGYKLQQKHNGETVQRHTIPDTWRNNKDDIFFDNMDAGIDCILSGRLDGRLYIDNQSYASALWNGISVMLQKDRLEFRMSVAAAHEQQLLQMNGMPYARRTTWTTGTAQFPEEFVQTVLDPWVAD